MGLQDVYEFDLVPVDPEATVAMDRWDAIQHHLLHMQPAKSVRLVGNPPTVIRVRAYGGTEVAPGLLARVAELAGTSLRVVAR